MFSMIHTPGQCGQRANFCGLGLNRFISVGIDLEYTLAWCRVGHGPGPSIGWVGLGWVGSKTMGHLTQSVSIDDVYKLNISYQCIKEWHWRDLRWDTSRPGACLYNSARRECFPYQPVQFRLNAIFVWDRP